MALRQANLLWLKDMLEHLSACQQQLLWTEDAESISILTESMLRELESCRRLCEALNRRANGAYQQAV